MTCPKSSTTTSSQTLSTSPMSWSTSSTVTPSAGSALRCSPSSIDSSASRPAAGPSINTSRGRWGSARATPPTLRRPGETARGERRAAAGGALPRGGRGAVGPPPQAERTVGVLAGAPADRQQQVAQRPQDTHPLAGDEQVLLDREVVEERAALPGAGEAAAGALVRAQAGDVVTVGPPPPRRGRGVAGRGVDRRLLAGAVGADRADDRARLDGQVDVIDGGHAAIGDAQRVDGQQGCHSSLLGRTSASNSANCTQFVETCPGLRKRRVVLRVRTAAPSRSKDGPTAYACLLGVSGTPPAAGCAACP